MLKGLTLICRQIKKEKVKKDHLYNNNEPILKPINTKFRQNIAKAFVYKLAKF